MNWFLNFSPGSLDVILVGLWIGVVIACGAIIYDRRKLGNFIRALIAAGALDPEHAVALKDLGYEKSGAVRRALRGNGVFAGTVFEKDDAPVFDREDHALPVYRESFDPEKARFYIPAALKYRAEVRFEKKGTHVMALVVGALLFGVVIFLILLFKDKIIATVKDWFTLMSA